MGMDARADVFFGIVYESGTDDCDRFKYVDDELIRGSPSWLADHDGYEGLRVVRIGWCDEPSYALAIDSSYIFGLDWTETELPDTSHPPEQAYLLKLYCGRWCLPYKEPKWYAAPYYG
jgi:hypothetical protein